MRLPPRSAVRRRLLALATAALGSCLLSAPVSLGARPPARTPAPGPGSTAAATTRANLLLVTIDTLRADHLGCYGDADIDTPHLDRLAAEGVRFDQVATTTPLTLPAHASILTGRYPFHHGVRDNLNFRLSDEATTLAEVLATAGYATGAFVGASVLDIRTGLARGFDTYSDPGGMLAPARARPVLQVERRGGQVASEALSWIANQQSFFAWVHLFDPHAPYAPPAPFSSAYEGREYDGEVAYVDQVVGDLMSGLEGLGHGTDTIVVVTADHGEGLGDHREQLHSLLVYDSTVRVPLLLWAPQRLPAGTVVRGQASVVDVLPTALAMLGVGDPDAGIRDGRDLRALVDDPEAPGRPVYAESMLPLLQFGWSELRSLRGNGLKYIAAPHPELYDLRSDGGEATNLIDRRPELAAAFRTELEQIAQRDDVDNLEFGRRFIDPEFDGRMRSLRALGYVAGVAATTGGGGARDDPKDDIETLEAFQQDSLGAERALANARWQEADAHIAALAARLPGHPMVYFYRGRSHLGQGRATEAIADLETAVSLASVNTSAWLDLAEAHRASGDPQHAYEVLGFAGDAFPSLAIFPLRRGLYLQQDGRRQEAERAYLTARDLAPLNPTVLRRLADLYLEDRDLSTARRVLNELVAAEPDAADAWSALADVHCALDELASCEAARRNALTSSPERADLYTSLGETLLRRGKREEAVEVFREALRRDPDQVKAGDALQRLGIGEPPDRAAPLPNGLRRSGRPDLELRRRAGEAGADAGVQRSDRGSRRTTTRSTDTSSPCSIHATMPPGPKASGSRIAGSVPRYDPAASTMSIGPSSKNVSPYRWIHSRSAASTRRSRMTGMVSANSTASAMRRARSAGDILAPPPPPPTLAAAGRS